MNLSQIRASAHMIPILAVKDIEASFAYYLDVLGFECRWDWGEPPTFGGVSFGKMQIFFCEGGQGNPGTWISLFIHGVDDYYHFVRANGADIARPIQDEPWGIREFHIRDPDGHILRAGTGHGHEADETSSKKP